MIYCGIFMYEILKLKKYLIIYLTILPQKMTTLLKKSLNQNHRIIIPTFSECLDLFFSKEAPMDPDQLHNTLKTIIQQSRVGLNSLPVCFTLLYVLNFFFVYHMRHAKGLITSQKKKLTWISPK